MRTNEKYLFSFYGGALIILSLCMVMMLLGSGLPINLHVSSQMKLAGEILIFTMTAFILLTKNRNQLVGRSAMIVLLILSATALVDIFVELSSGDAENLIVVFIILAIMLIMNLLVLIVLLRRPST